MLSIGPFPLPAAALSVALLVAVIVSHQVGKRGLSDVAASAFPAAVSKAASPARGAASVVFDMFFVGIVAARMAFVVRWLQPYLAEPWSVLRIGDGGFIWWAGLLAGLAWGAWKLRYSPSLRLPLLAGVLAGLAVWSALLGSIALMQHSAVALPTTEMSRLDGERVSFVDMAGRPIVVNLWATWCPPCRREMPVLAEGQEIRTGVEFVFVNQGEGPDQIREYLQSEGLSLDNVLLDPFSSLMHEMGARGLPTTLFFDADGRLVDFHMGELTRAGLASKLQVIDSAPGSHPPIPQEVP